MTRRSFDEAEHSRIKVTPTLAADDLFAVQDEGPPSWARTWGTLTLAEQRAQRARWQELLLPVVLELAQRTAPPGVTWSEVAAVGMEKAILWGEPSFLKRYPRIYSWGGAWLSLLSRQGRLAPKTHHVEGHGVVHLRRDSESPRSHHNDGLIYVRAA